MANISNPTFIDLFAGAGGMTLGFQNVGFENIFSIDIENSYCDTYKANFPRHNLIQEDISKLTKKDILKLIKNRRVDVIIGGPPCQGFSIAGNIGRRFINDPRNQLFKEFARIVRIVKPNYFVMENVARLFTHDKGRTKVEIFKLFEKMNYKVECKVLNAGDFGVPQIRRRVVFIGNKKGSKILFPEKRNERFMTVREALDHYPNATLDASSTIPNHKAMNHSEQMLKKMKYVTEGGSRSEIPDSIRPTSGDVRKYIRYDSSKPSICITGDMRKVFHYRHNRALTVRELAKLQSFPDSFVFKGTSISQQQQVGNAVPPLLAEAIASTVKQMMNYKDE